jgi:hypothetical protein
MEMRALDSGTSSAWRLLLKIAIAMFSGGVAYLLTLIGNQPQVWTITITTFVGGVTLVVQVLVDVDATVRKAVAAQAEYFRNINKATELFARVDASELRSDAVIDLIATAASVDRGVGPLMAGMMNLQLGSARRFFQQLATNSRIEYEGEEYEWMFGLVALCTESVAATSTIGASGRGLVDERFWTSPLAFRYLSLHRDAVRRRGVRIRRIFVVFEDATADDHQISVIIARNQEAGVEVRVLNAANIPPEMDRSMDFVVVDNEISYEPLPVRAFPGTRPMTTIQTTVLEFSPDVISRRTEEFEVCWEAAREP